MNSIDVFRDSIGNEELALIISSVNRRYLTSFLSSDGYLLISKDFAELYLDSRYYEMAEKSKASGNIPGCVELKHSGVYERINELMSSGKYSVLLYEDKRLFCSELENIKSRLKIKSVAPLDNRLEDLRKVKSKAEFEKMISAQKIADDAFGHILGFITPDRTEKEIALELEFYMRKNGAENVSFDTICVSGKKSSMPHGRPDDIKVTKNSFLTMDFGAVYDGYCSDMTRTVCVGKADEEMKNVYETVRLAQGEAITNIKSGLTGKYVDGIARDIISSAGYGDYFGHSLGHSLGLEIHEAPRFSPNAAEKVISGNILSVEPGIYIPDKFGVRIEDVVMITDDGCIDITKSPKELIEL